MTADQLFDAAIVADPENALAYTNLGLISGRGGRWPEAENRDWNHTPAEVRASSVTP